MSQRKKSKNSMRATSLSDALTMCERHAAENRRPIKVLEDLMGLTPRQLYVWLGKASMPLNRLRQFEEFCGVSYVSEYLCIAHGNKIVIEIPTGKKADVTDLAEVQANFAEAITLLSRFYQNGQGLEETVAALSTTLSQLAFQRSNVMKRDEPELSLFGDAA